MLAKQPAAMNEVHVEGNGQPHGHPIVRHRVAKPLGRVGVEPAVHRAADRPGVEQERDGQEQRRGLVGGASARNDVGTRWNHMTNPGDRRARLVPWRPELAFGGPSPVRHTANVASSAWPRNLPDWAPTLARRFPQAFGPSHAWRFHGHSARHPEQREDGYAWLCSELGSART